MAHSRGHLAWSATKLIVGFALFALSALLLLVSAHSRVSLPLALAAVAFILLVAPIAMTVVLLPSLRRIDKDSTFLNSVFGLLGLWSVILLVGLPALGRSWISRVLIATPRFEHELPPIVTCVLATLGHRLEVPPTPHRPPARPVQQTPIAVSPPASIDASTAHDATTLTPVPTRDATVAIDAQALRDEPDVSSEPLPTSLAIEVTACAQVQSVTAVNLAQGSPDELVVGCADGVRVFWLQGPALFLRTLVTFTVRTPLLVVAGDPLVADLDEDGHRDLGLCVYYTTDRGGTRGGKSWWARGRDSGQFGSPASLDDGDCAALATGDVTGDGHNELFVLREGNPWQPSNPDGSVFWYARAGARWQLRGNFPLFPYPEHIWVADGNGDGVGDLFVTGDSHAAAWFEGSPRGLQRTDAGAPDLDPPSQISLSGDFDGDGHPDRIEVTHASTNDPGAVRVFTTTPRNAVIRSSTNALDFVEYPLSGR